MKRTRKEFKTGRGNRMGGYYKKKDEMEFGKDREGKKGD